MLAFLRKKDSLYTLAKAQSVSAISTVLDFSFTVFLKEVLNLWYALSSVSGTFVGGCICFILSRNWVFKIKNKNKLKQIKKFIIIWVSSLALNFLGILLLTEQFTMNYLLSKIIIAFMVGILFNYNLQSIYVFKN
jgi:putative flippase GtrA